LYLAEKYFQLDTVKKIIPSLKFKLTRDINSDTHSRNHS